MARLYVVGALGRKVEIPDDADVVAAFPTVAEAIGVEAEILPYPVDRALDRIEELLKRGRVAVVLSGDPLFYGYGEKIKERFPEAVIIPSVSYMQYAFSLMGRSWQDANFVSIHARPMEEVLTALRGEGRYLFVFTDKRNSPDRLAAFLLDRGIEVEAFWVFERLALEGETFSKLTLEQAKNRKFAYPNCVVIEKKRGSCADVWDDSSYLTRKGLLTKAPVRAIVSSLVGSGKVFWDVGAGTGSVSITLSANFDLLYAVEKDNVDLLKENIKHFAAWNVIPVEGEAPAALKDLPDPDAVFLGCGHRNFFDIVDAVWERLKESGRVVATFVSTRGVEAGLRAKDVYGGRLFQIILCDYSEDMGRVRVPVWIWASQRST